MAWNYRRSVKIAPGVRLNLSKRGVGYSFGVPGFRISKSASGRITRTRSIPGTGLYERETLSSPSKRQQVPSNSNSDTYSHTLGMFRSENQESIKKQLIPIKVKPKKSWTIFVGLLTISAISGNFGSPNPSGTSKSDSLFFTILIVIFFTYRLYRHKNPRIKMVEGIVVNDSEISNSETLEHK